MFDKIEINKTDYHRKQNIKEIEFDLNCRHEIIPILMGLQRIYKKRRLLGEILYLIKQDILGGKSEKHGTQGLCYWEILVLSAVRHGCNLDYDALRDLANNHISGIGFKFKRMDL